MIRYVITCDDCGTTGDASTGAPAAIRKELVAAGWRCNLRILTHRGRLWDLCPTCRPMYEADEEPVASPTAGGQSGTRRGKRE